MKKDSITRRKFIARSAAALGSIGIAGLTKSHAIGANDRINMGVIGVGGMGTGHVHDLAGRSEKDNIRCLAVCDVYQRRVTRAQEACQGEGCTDYRKLLERPDIDAVLIATPDHWHAKISIDAMEAGKHVYVEKPMTHTIEQALQVRDAVHRTGKVLQVGPQATSDDGTWLAREALQAGRIGQVTWAHGGYNRNARECLFNAHQKPDPGAGPDKSGEDYINWDMWLGHEWGLAPKIPWTPDHFFRFRKYWPYSGGVATDLLYHKLAPLLLAIAGPNGEYPRRVNASGGLYVEKDGRDIPDTFLMTADFPSQFSIFLVSTLTNDSGMPDRIYGKYGTMEFGDSLKLNANGDFGEEFRTRNDGKDEVRLEKRPRGDHKAPFFDAIRGNGTVTCNADLGAATMVAIKMAVESYRQNKTFLWDAEKETMLG